EEAAAATRGDRPPLEREARERDVPAVTDRSDAIRIGNDDIVEEHLGEVRVAVHLTQRADVDARRAEVEPERGDALVLRDGGVVTGEQQSVARVRTAAGPHFLTRHAP